MRACGRSTRPAGGRDEYLRGTAGVFSGIRVGNSITARYYDNVVIRLEPEGEAAIDRKVPSITFKGEKVSWTYSSRVADGAAPAKVEVGDRVDSTWNGAIDRVPDAVGEKD
jgi:hypothetical protein